jgi:hypothetical protein
MTIAASLLCGTVGVAAAVVPPAPEAFDLQPHTLAAFQRYAAATEGRVLQQVPATGPFLYIDHLPQRERDEILAELRAGEMYMDRLHTRTTEGEEFEIEDGLVHHWLGVVFVPGATLEETMVLIQDYDRHAQIYAPHVAAAHIIERDGQEFEVFMRFRKEKVITVVMDTVHDVHYVSPAPDRTYSISRTTSVREVEEAGTAQERVLPDGQGSGFLWRLNSYWRFQERDGGTYVECESISLTRTIPFVLRWLIGPFVNDVPREQLAELLQTTRQTLMNAPERP